MKADIRFLTFASILLLIPVDICSQKILDPDYEPPNVRWDNFLVKGGQASQTSTCIFIDSKGFIWSGTETGLYRFDGVRYVEYGVSAESNNGFAGFTVTNIFEDSEGTIWIGTSEALNKLDQRTGTFLHYYPDSAQQSGMSNFIRAIREDRNGLLWILTRKDIFSFNSDIERFERYAVDSLSWYPEDYYPLSEEQCFAEDSRGNILFITFSSLYLYNTIDKVFSMAFPGDIDNRSEGLNKVRCVNTDKNGAVWIGTDGGLLKWDENKNKADRIEIQPSGKYRNSFKAVSVILPDNDGSLWCFGNSAFSRYNPEDGSLRNYIFIYKHRSLYEYPENDLFINEAFQNDDGTVWFLNKLAGLLFRFDPASEKLSLYRVPNFYVFQCVMDKTGSLWFACVRNNIFRLVTSQIPYLRIPVNNSSHVAQIHRGAFLEDDQEQVYFLFLPGLYLCKRFDVSSSLIIKQFRFPDGETVAGGGFKDSNGNLWFGDKDGNITRFNPLTGELVNLTHNSSQGYTEVVYVPLIREDKAGYIWVATFTGLIRIDPAKGKIEHILDFKDNSVTAGINYLMDFLIDSQGTFWILADESALSVRMPDTKITDFTTPGDSNFGSFSGNIRVGEDRTGNIYILNGRSGLFRFDRRNGSFMKIDIFKEEPGWEYYDMLIDRRDRIWIPNNKGITIFDPRNKNTRSIKTPRLQFDVQSYQLKSGHILVLNNNELYVFYEDLPFNTNIPPVFLTRLLVNGQDYNKILEEKIDISTAIKVELPFRLNTITIEFAALNYLNPELNRYRYFMTKRDKDTLFVPQGSTAEYKRLPPGHYKFWVTGSNNDGIWNPSGATLDIRILPPWYRSNVAYLLFTLSALLTIGAYIRIRTRNLRLDKIKLEAEVKERTSELQEANRQLADVDRIKTNFFTSISHEIRTPLSLILGPLEHFSKDGTLDKHMSGMIAIMKRNALRMMNLINQLLDISRLDAGKMKITLAEDDIVKCMRILVFEFLSYAESKDIRYITDLPKRPYKIWFDRDKIEKITSNLLSNAFRFTQKNGTVQCFVSIESDERNNSGTSIHIRVTDTGKGIGREHQKRIFDRFYTVDEQHERNGYGTGIGLALVREFVSLLHGEIKVESIQGKGSEFSVVVPLGKDHLSEEEFIIIQQASPAADHEFIFQADRSYEAVSNKKDEKNKIMMLLIEDNADLRMFIKESLSDDYVILEADNGKSGINMAFTMMPDIVITDIMMSDLDGISLCDQLKNDERTSHIPIIILTAKATSEDRILGLKSGADDYIIKPFNMAELNTRIANLLTIRDKLKLKYSKFYSLESGKGIPGSVDDKFIGKVIRIINLNLHNYTFDVAALVDQLGMSRSHFSRKLTILTGLPPGTLIKNIRLEKAAELLLAKKGNIAQIANSVGMTNPSSFTKAFRKYFGVSPKEYVKH